MPIIALGSRNNLAGAYETVGDPGRAIPLYEATFTDSERVLGPDHPMTRTIRSHLDEARLTRSRHRAVVTEPADGSVRSSALCG